MSLTTKSLIGIKSTKKCEKTSEEKEGEGDGDARREGEGEEEEFPERDEERDEEGVDWIEHKRIKSERT